MTNSSSRWRAVGALVPRDRHAAIVLAVAIIIGVVAPLAVAAVSGNLSIPHNDAWAYSRIAETFGRDGRVELLGWNRSSLLGQVVVLGPFARSIVVQQIFVALMAAVLIECVFLLLRDRLGEMRAALAALATSLWPGFALLATSYMTDIPSLATALLALVTGRTAMRRDSRALYALALVTGSWSAMIRLPTGAAALVAIVVVAVATRRSRVRRPFVVVAASVTAAANVVFLAWYRSLPGGDPESFTLRSDAIGYTVDATIAIWFTLALAAGPVALLVGQPRWWRRRAYTAFAVVLALGMVRLFVSPGSTFLLGNYLGPQGPYAGALALEKTTFDDAKWTVVILFAIVMGAVLAGAVANGRGGVEPLLSVFTLVSVAAIVVGMVTPQGVIDRYLLAVVPFVLALALRRPPDSASPPGSPWTVATQILGGAAVVGSALLCAALFLNAMAFDRARWDVALSQTSSTPASRIDAGLEWLGWHSPRGVVDRYPDSGYGWQALISTEPACVVVTAVQPPPRVGDGWVLAETIRYPTFLVAGQSVLFVWRTGATGCE